MSKKWKIICLLLLLMLFFSVTVLGESLKIPVSNFKIVSFRSEWSMGAIRPTLWAIGEVKNIGSVAAGVELEAIARDTNGKVVDSNKFWPNVTNNIPPGVSIGFKAPVTVHYSAKTVELKAIMVWVW